ncbi:MAG: TonB-dependent receptor plug domain-containing protein [Candidatus Cryptobacteroides sp.]
MRLKPMQKRAIIHFSRWNRKGWSAFASMHREIKICVLSVSMSIISSATLTGADKEDNVPADTSRTVRLEEAQVTTSRAVQVRSAMPQTTLYRRSTDAAAPLQNYESALKLLPSVDVRERGGLGSQADIAVRGGTADQTMVMLNGINFTDARTGHQSHSLPIDMECVSGITLLDAVPGAGALSGAVNINTRGLYPRYLRTEVSGGIYGYLYGSASGAYSLENADLFGAVSFRNSDGYRHNTDYRNWNAFFRATAGKAENGTFDFQIGAQKRSFGSNGFYAAYNPEQYEQTSTYLASLRWSARYGNLGLGASVSYRKNFDRYDWTRGTVMNRHNTDNAGAELRSSYDWAAGSTTIGADWMYNHILSSNLGDLLDTPKGPDGRYKRAKSRNTVNLYLRHFKSWEHIDIAAMGGASFTPYGTASLWSASVLARPFEGFSVKASAGQSMRLPTFTDLYYTSAAQVNNLDLVPEKAITYSIGADYASGPWNVGLYAYFRDTRDRIAWVWRDELTVGENRYTSVWHSEQITRMYSCGVEASGGYRSDKGFLRTLTVSYGFIDSDEKSKVETSTVLDYMRHKASVNLEVFFLRRFTFAATASVYDRYGSYNSYEFDSDGNPVRDENNVMITHKTDFKPYFLLDVRLSCAFMAFRLYADVKNVTNTRYCDFGGVIMPGIWATAGVVVTVR